jgi:hypothetical protein
LPALASLAEYRRYYRNEERSEPGSEERIEARDGEDRQIDRWTGKGKARERKRDVILTYIPVGAYL